MFGLLKRVGIPKDTLLKMVEAMDADEDGFVTVGEAYSMLKEYAKAAKKAYKPDMIRRRGQ